MQHGGDIFSKGEVLVVADYCRSRPPMILMATTTMVMGTTLVMATATKMVVAMSRVGFLAKVVPCWAPD